MFHAHCALETIGCPRCERREAQALKLLVEERKMRLRLEKSGGNRYEVDEEDAAEELEKIEKKKKKADKS